MDLCRGLELTAVHPFISFAAPMFVDRALKLDRISVKPLTGNGWDSSLLPTLFDVIETSLQMLRMRSPNDLAHLLDPRLEIVPQFLARRMKFDKSECDRPEARSSPGDGLAHRERRLFVSRPIFGEESRIVLEFD